MVLRSQVGLDPLALRHGTIVDVFAGNVAADEGDRLDGWIVADPVDSVGAPVYPMLRELGSSCAVDVVVSHVKDPWRHTCPFTQLGNDHGRSRVSL
jgi:hypothetical protein